MKIKAYAKVNLGLKVFKGVHEAKHHIDTIMFLYKKLFDEISISKYEGTYVLYKDQGKQVSVPNCIISKCLKYLQSKYGFDINYKIIVKKNIPFGAGLGGGSSDAAAVMNYILRQNDPVQLDLKEIALELGSDIPFFLTNYQMARVKLEGQHVAPMFNWRPKIKLHFTGIACSTTEVFNSLEDDKEYASRVNIDKLIQNHLYKQHSINVVYNDLTKYIIQNYKELQEVYKKYPNKSFFTGAGSTIVTIEE